MDTIFAPATARGRAGIAVVRLSGPLAFAAAERLAGPLPSPRRAVLRRLVADGDLLDEAVLLAFEPGHSFTGEAVVEFQVHGSPAVLSAVLSALGAMPGLRLAEPGEFTRRALENGRMDLVQVEGLADLLEAETKAQRRQAQRVLSGAIGRAAEVWRGDLIRAAALIEATIDFADEDVPVDVTPEVMALIDRTAAALRVEIAGSAVAERIRDGFEVAILGRPNVGKSTLINALAGREAALTSPYAGTTRDVIEVRMDLAGLAVTILDTAGLREAEDPVERMGVARARARAEAADLRLFLMEPGEPPSGPEPRPGDIVLTAKADLHPDAPDAVSGLTGKGLDRLVARIAAVLSDRAAGAATVTRARHRSALERAVRALDGARGQLVAGQADLAAEDMRAALRALDALVGRVDVEHILDHIFASFCIGK
jgi:tRNA modification GTPase